MQTYVVVEMFKGGKIPQIRGIFTDKIKAEQIKNDCRFAYIDEQMLVQTQNEKDKNEVYIVIELMTLNVPNVIGVFKNKELAEEMALNAKYKVQIIEEILL